jgi:hypothetical protein
MQMLFVDESSPAPKQPSRRCHPYFVLAGLAVPELNWHSLARTLANIKRRAGVNGEIKWRYFAEKNNEPQNPMRGFSKAQRDAVREEMFAALRTRHHVRCMAVVASIQDAFKLPYVNSDDDLYFYCLKILTERFQYRIQDVNREYGITWHGIIILDGRDPAKDGKIRELHDRIVTNNTEFSSNYPNIIEGLMITASHLSPGTQFVDSIAGATHHYFSTGNRYWFDMVLPVCRRNDRGRVEGTASASFLMPNGRTMKDAGWNPEAPTPAEADSRRNRQTYYYNYSGVPQDSCYERLYRLPVPREGSA